MMNILERAEFIASLLTGEGVVVDEVTHSINRLRGQSSYIRTGPWNGIRLPTLRVSDHACNTDYRVNEIDVFWETEDQVKEYLREALEWVEKNKEDRRLAIIARDVFESAARQEYMSTGNPGVVGRLYPGRSASERRSVRERWEGNRADESCYVGL